MTFRKMQIIQNVNKLNVKTNKSSSYFLAEFK